MKLKLGDNGQPLYQDGKFVLILDDGSEAAFDAVGAYSTFGKIREERDAWKTKAEAAETEIATFGKTAADRQAAVEKLRLAANLDAKKLIDAGKVDEVVTERLRAAQSEWQTEREKLVQDRDGKAAQLRRVLISNRIGSTKALDDYFLTPDLFEAKFGQHFDLEGDEVVAFADPGRKTKLYSRSDPTKLASVDEAISVLVKADPNHDRWRKGVNANGTGAPGNAGGGGNGKSMSVDEFQKLPADQRMKFIAQDGGTLT